MASGESVSDLFMAGVVPGLLIGALLMVYAIYYCKKHGEDKEKIAAVDQLMRKDLSEYLKKAFFCNLKSGYYPWMYLYWSCISNRSSGYFRTLFFSSQLIYL